MLKLQADQRLRCSWEATPSRTEADSSVKAAGIVANPAPVAVQSGSGYVDVTVRVVDATNGANLTQAWQTISSQVLVTNTFMTTFNALLMNAGAPPDSHD